MTGRKVGPYLVAVAITGLLIFLAYLIFFVPQMNATAGLRAQTDAARVTNSGLQSKVRVLEEKKKNLTLLKGQVDNLTTAFPSAVKEQDLFAAITQAAGSTGVTITTLNPAAPVLGTTSAALSPGGAVGGSTSAQVAKATPPAGNTATTTAATPANGAAAAPGQAAATSMTDPLSAIALIGMNITATGSQDQLKAFLTKVEKLQRPLVVTSVDITTMQSGGSSMQIAGNTFLTKPLVEPTVPAAAPSPATTPSK